jgi:hypothetical protein
MNELFETKGYNFAGIRAAKKMAVDFYVSDFYHKDQFIKSHNYIDSVTPVEYRTVKVSHPLIVKANRLITNTKFYICPRIVSVLERLISYFDVYNLRE